MTAPAHRVLTLVRGMARINRAESAAVEDVAPDGRRGYEYGPSAAGPGMGPPITVSITDESALFSVITAAGGEIATE